MLSLFKHNAQESPTQGFMQNRTDSTSFFKSQSGLTCECPLKVFTALPALRASRSPRHPSLLDGCSHRCWLREQSRIRLVGRRAVVRRRPILLLRAQYTDAPERRGSTTPCQSPAVRRTSSIAPAREAPPTQRSESELRRVRHHSTSSDRTGPSLWRVPSVRRLPLHRQ